MSLDEVIDNFREKRWKNATAVLILPDNKIKYKDDITGEIREGVPSGEYEFIYLDQYKNRIELKRTSSSEKGRTYIVVKEHNQ